MSNLVLSPDQQGFTSQQVATLKQLGVDKASEGDLAVFFHQCIRTGLDPFAKQIYMVGRFDSRANAMRYTIQTAIDGYRLIAERTGLYAGSDESWVEKDGRPVSATVVVRKIVAGLICDFSATARWEEYVQAGKDGKPMGLWGKMPHRMLAKCAEALALRKAFPQDLSGIYTSEEMSQADIPAVVTATIIPMQPKAIEANPSVSAENIERFKGACSDAALDWREIANTAGVNLDNMHESDMDLLRAAYTKAKATPKPVINNVDTTTEIVDSFQNDPNEQILDVGDVLAKVVDLFAGAEVIEESRNNHPANGTPQIKEPGAPATAPQLGKLRALCGGAGITSKEDQLSMASDHTKRTITSFNDLTKKEASELIGILAP